MSDKLRLPTKGQVAVAVEAMRAAHFRYGYTRWPRDYYLETMFWSGFFAAYLKSTDTGSVTNGR